MNDQTQQNSTTPTGAASALTEMLAVEHAPTPKSQCVVRLRTTVWSDKSGLHLKKSLTFLRRQCVGFNILEEDSGAIGAEEVFPKIENLDECKDGIYVVVVCNESHDYESGYVDDYDYRLVPLETANVEHNRRPQGVRVDGWVGLHLTKGWK